MWLPRGAEIQLTSHQGSCWRKSPRDPRRPRRELYHLLINTVVGDENVIAAILNGMQTLEAHTAESALRGVR